MDKPLALKLAPSSINEVIGQKHLIGEGKILSNLVASKKLFSMIFYGKPGIGKTSIANAIVRDLDVRYRSLNAVINSKHDFDIVFEEAKVYEDGIVLILDEIHRLNKDKQDLLLPQIESGRITLIGMTTSNPYHKINPAIRSRCHLFELHELEHSDIVEGLNRAIIHPDLIDIVIGEEEINYIATLASSDLRYAYNLLEMIYYSSSDKKITIDFIKSINSKPVFFHDKNEDGHFDVLSALQKSIRGSDVNASLHYLARLIEVGDLDSIYRRLSAICYEDIGLANSGMGPKLYAAIEASELIGLPEARLPLSNIVIELALSPKSNSAYLAIEEAMSDIETGRAGKIPSHIKNGSNEYKYPHDYPNAFVKQQYLPDNLKQKKYYHPKDTSPNERILKQIDDKLDNLNKKSNYN